MVFAYRELSVFVYLSYNEKHLTIGLLAHHVPPLIAIRVLCTCDSQNDSCWYSLSCFCQLGVLL